MGIFKILEIQDNIILDFYVKKDEEAKILNCFLDDNEQLLFHCFESSFLPNSNIDISRKNFVLNRTVIKSKDKLFETLNHADSEMSYWYCTLDNKELIQEIEEMYYDYTCVVLEVGKNIKNYTYLLSIEENYPFTEDEDCRALIIKEGRSGNFKSKVLPRIKRILDSV